MRLTRKRVERLKEPGRYGDGNGLYLQITPAEVRSWLFRFEKAGRERWMGLGPLHTVTLEEARDKARRARQQLREGIDPLEAKAAGRAAAALADAKRMTFGEAAQSYFESREKGWKNAKHRAQFLSTLQQYAFPVMERMSVGDIDTGTLLKVLEPVWHTKTETATRVRGRIEAILDWAMVRGFRSGDNPAAWKRLSKVLASPSQIAQVNHFPALPFVEVGDFMSRLTERPAIAARALEFTILTAARTGEVVGARWSEMNLSARVWTVPVDRMKAKREHRVPLSPRAGELLNALPREGEFVFPGGRSGAPISNMAMKAVLKRLGRADITVHGFRSTFRDWAAERTNYPNHVVEMALAHSIGDKVEASYRRGDLFVKRARLMGDWAKYCTSPMVSDSVVVPIRAA